MKSYIYEENNLQGVFLMVNFSLKNRIHYWCLENQKCVFNEPLSKKIIQKNFRMTS